jgi:hypothetical protein
MTEIHDAQALRQLVQATGTTVLLISDDDGSVCEVVHAKAEQVAKPWQRAGLVLDLAILTAAERQLWFSEKGHYAVVGGSARVVAVRGPISDLLLSNGRPSAIEIRFAMAKGDVLP